MTGRLPRVSIVLPVRNEAAYITRSLGSILAQDYPSSLMEVLVADGASEDGTPDMVRALMASHPHVRLIHNPGRIVAAGLNRAIADARGDIIVRVDGHAEVPPDYVRRCVDHIASGVDGVGGAVRTIGETPLAHVIATAMSSKFGVGDSAFRTETGRSMLADTVPFPAYTRAIVERAGPYDTELVRNQDDEYNYRLRKMGARILLAADVQSSYYSRSSIGSLWRQYLQYGYWKVRVLQKHPLQMSARQFVPPLFVGGLLCAAAAALLWSWGWLLLAAVLGAYVLASITATAIVMQRHALARPYLLPVVFATIHLAYGAGFLLGLLRFWNRWFDARGAAHQPASAGVAIDLSRERRS